jgi:hypothetical protein
MAPSLNSSSAIVYSGGSPDNLSQGAAKIDAHWHEYDAILATNRTGAQRVAGDVVAWDTANDTAFVAADAVASLRGFGVVAATIANVAAGEVVRAGLCVAKATGSIARGEYVRKSATAWSVEGTGVIEGAAMPEGTLGAARTAAAGGVVTILLFTGPRALASQLLVAAPATVDNAVANSTVTATLLSTTLRANRLSAGRALVIRCAARVTHTPNVAAGSLVRFHVTLGGSADLLAGLSWPFSVLLGEGNGAARWDSLLAATAANAQAVHTIARLDRTGLAAEPLAATVTAAEDLTADLALAVTMDVVLQAGSTGALHVAVDHVSVEILR